VAAACPSHRGTGRPCGTSVRPVTIRADRRCARRAAPSALRNPTMSKGGAKARHSVRNWRFYVPAHGTRGSNRDPPARRHITNLLGKLPRNVSDHENLQCFQGEIDCTLVRKLARRRDYGVSAREQSRRRRSAQIPDTVSRETDGGPTGAAWSRRGRSSTPVAAPGRAAPVVRPRSSGNACRAGSPARPSARRKAACRPAPPDCDARPPRQTAPPDCPARLPRQTAPAAATRRSTSPGFRAGGRRFWRARR
jgi:hypothetical protein